MKDLPITEIEIVPVKPQNGLVAFASCVFDDRLYLGHIAIVSSLSHPDGFRLIYPTKSLLAGKAIHCFFPINRDTGQLLHKAIVGKFLKLIASNGAREKNIENV